MITTVLTTLFIVYIIYNEYRYNKLVDQINNAFQKESKILDKLVELLGEQQIKELDEILNK